MKSELRIFLAVMLLAAVAIVALWPRDSHMPDSIPPSTGTSDLGQLRAAAQLMACPVDSPGVAPIVELADITVPCLGNGESVHIGSALAGKTTLINVWASWCQPCREELPVLNEYAASQRNVVVLGMQIRNDNPTAGLELLTSLGIRFASVSDPDSRLQAALRVPPALPASYVIRSDGHIRRITDPLIFQSVEQVRAAVAAQLKDA